MFLAVVGIPVGIVMGLWVTRALYHSLSTEAYSLKVILYPGSYVMIILSILVVLLISEIPPIRRIFKLDLAEATKVIE
jgi:ABC-type antimicrobial peptide transport system permease subunit